jgi:DNA-binding NtrC family response regulator
MTNANWAEDCINRAGGQDRLIKDLTVQLLRRFKGEQRMHAAGNAASNLLTILFEGHSGNGKRHLAKTIASTANYINPSIF